MHQFGACYVATPTDLPDLPQRPSRGSRFLDGIGNID